MQKNYYCQLKRSEKKKVQEQYKKEYAHSDFQNRLIRLAVYSAIGILFSIFLIVYSIITKEYVVSNLLVAIPLFIAAIVFMVGRQYAKLQVLNKIALKQKN